MQRICTSARRTGPTSRRSRVTAAMALAGASLFSLGTIQATGYGAAGAVTPEVSNTGFTQPFSGTPQYEQLAPTEIRGSGQLNQPIGQRVADAIAARLGLEQGRHLHPAAVRRVHLRAGSRWRSGRCQSVDDSVRIFTNTIGRPLYSNVDGHLTPSVLASYGLFVNTSGSLESLANTDAPTRQANSIIAPGGYLGSGAWPMVPTASLDRALQVGVHAGSRLRLHITAHIRCCSVGHEHRGWCDLDRWDVDGPFDLAGELPPALLVEPVAGGLHAREVGTNPSHRCQRHLVQPHRPGSLR